MLGHARAARNAPSRGNDDGPREDLAGAVATFSLSPKGTHYGVISRMIGLSATATPTLVDGVTEAPAALVSG